MKKTLYILTLIISTFSFSQDILMENGSFTRCAPDKFYDSGGEFGNYGNDENLVTTICPQNADEFIILNFTSFTTQLGAQPDVMNIYDGDDVTAPLIGSFQGPATVGAVSATDTNVSGCLTVEFISNSSGNIDGWEADILCATPCQDIVASISNSNPAPNASGVIGILPGDSVDFSGSATFSIDDTDATYNWDFGDFNLATGADVSHTFATAGTYTVTLTVSDNNPQGCSDTTTITVFVLGPNVVVDQETFTPEQLIQDVLVDSPCASVSNIIASTGSTINATLPNGIGYFFSNGVDFPFEDGLLLTTGDASRAGGPNNVNLSDGSWAGDADLDTYLGVDSNDATYIQFEFTPLADSISFDFLMASEEYDMGSFECNYSDAFAFLLTDSLGNVTNLAVLPSTNTPILVTNIHPDNGASCGGINEEYFGAYTPSSGPPIAFDGRTTVFTAQSAVVPGEVYTIKLVIADDRDNSFDSGVFIKAGSFNLGGNLGDDITIAAGTAECDGTEIILDTELSLATHIWYKDDVVIPGETSSTITVTEPGVYYADFDFSGVCTGSADPILIEFRNSPTASPAQNILICSGTGTEEFDLSENDDDILGGQDPLDFFVSYHLTEQDAIDNVGALPIPYTNISSPQTIWARLADVTQTCVDTVSFTISAAGQPTINPASDLELCDDESNDGFEEFDLGSQTAIILGSQPSS
ncbi:choice-of-anchor L domain-containing protein, partial [Winogradskyella eximia]|uniref:choice-of-anchor L domain-containing protein n=1 Tax=Winogradskyella eximia TaxID=262006 RepID=UPI002492AFC4